MPPPLLIRYFTVRFDCLNGRLENCSKLKKKTKEKEISFLFLLTLFTTRNTSNRITKPNPHSINMAGVDQREMQAARTTRNDTRQRRGERIDGGTWLDCHRLRLIHDPLLFTLLLVCVAIFFSCRSGWRRRWRGGGSAAR